MSIRTLQPAEDGRVNRSAADSAEPRPGNPLPQTTLPPLDSRVRIGHVHLKVADLDRAIVFYRDVLGFEVTQRFSRNAAFLSAGGYHHHIGLNTWESAGGSPPPPGATGLYHLAILYPTRAELATALRRLLDAGISLEGAADHGVSEALYLRDPDSNGVELLLGPAAGRVAPHHGRPTGDVYASLGFGVAAQRKQKNMKRILRTLAWLLVIAAGVTWLATGANRGWTKTSVPVKTLDEVAGIEGITYQKKFLPGVDFLGAAFGGAALLAGASFLFRKPKPNNNQTTNNK